MSSPYPLARPVRGVMYQSDHLTSMTGVTHRCDAAHSGLKNRGFCSPDRTLGTLDPWAGCNYSHSYPAAHSSVGRARRRPTAKSASISLLQEEITLTIQLFCERVTRHYAKMQKRELTVVIPPKSSACS